MNNPDIRPERLVKKFQSNYECDADDLEKKEFLVALFRFFSSLVARKEFRTCYPEFSHLYHRVCVALEEGTPEDMEVNLVQLYCYLHSRDSSYSPKEREEFDECGGYWCHAGGVSPLIQAKSHITPKTRFADYGAGNGLQGLLFQSLYPHRKTTLVELSMNMIERGKRLQSLMQIPEERVDWVHKNVLDVSPLDFDFIYIYRPVRPDGRGREFYERFADALDQARHTVTIFSVADCLKDFLGSTFRIFYDDGHLTCFSNKGLYGTGPGEGKSSLKG